MQLTPATLRDAVRDLCALGVTRQKAAYLVALAEHVTDGRLDLQALPTLPDDEVLVALERVPSSRGAAVRCPDTAAPRLDGSRTERSAGRYVRRNSAICAA